MIDFTFIPTVNSDGLIFLMQSLCIEVETLTFSILSLCSSHIMDDEQKSQSSSRTWQHAVDEQLVSEKDSFMIDCIFQV